MQSLNLAAGRIWSFSDETGDTIRLSLPEILLSDVQLQHAPAFGYLAPLQHELLASILQCSVDTILPNGISKKDYALLVHCENVQSIVPLVEKISDQLESIEGFCLAGNGAFMQMPAAWKNSGNKMQIARLMWPFIPNAHKTSQAKGIRRMAPIPVKLGTDLAALFLFASCTLPKGGTRYWTIGNLAGRTILHARHGKTLRQQLFSSVLPGYSPHWKRIQPLPWVSSCLNNGGLEANGTPPFLPYITGGKKLKGSANIRFFQARGIVLGPPEYGICDVSEEYSQVFTTYSLLEDRAIHKQVVKCAGPGKKRKAANILGKMFRDTTHPSVAVDQPTVQEREGNSIFNLPYHGYAIPAWAVMGKAHPFPSQVIQAHPAISESTHRGREYSWSCFLLKYAPKQQDPRGLFQYHCPSSMTFDAHTLQQVVFLEETTEESIKQIRSGMRLLFSNRNRNQKLKANTSELVNHYMLDISQHLWIVSDQLLHEFLATSPDTETWQGEVSFSLHKEMYSCWNRFLTDDWESRSLSYQDHRQEYRATCAALGDHFMDFDRSYLEANPTVRAGRAFARTFYQLGSSKQSQLLNETAPYISEYFWICMRKARQEDPRAYQQMYEQALPLLIYIKPVADEKNLGRILAEQKYHVNSKRIELLFSEEDREMLIDTLLQLFHLISSKNGRPVRVDFGVLLLDLSQFHFRPSMVIRRWATDYFPYSVRNDQKEKDYVQA